jgi:hypothetical protein
MAYVMSQFLGYFQKYLQNNTYILKMLKMKPDNLYVID